MVGIRMAPVDEVVDPEEEDVEEDEEVYSVENRYIKDMYGTYYMTMGGGEQAGYLHHLESGKWYLVHNAGWGGEWKVYNSPPMVYTPEDWRIGRVASIKKA
jgi:hypothetical protein